jgi:hypothetical protein
VSAMDNWPKIKKGMMAFNHQEREELKFIAGPFSKMALNIPPAVGGSVVTDPHVDSLNYVRGLCCVIGLGEFIQNFECFLSMSLGSKTMMLVLPDLKLLLEIRPLWACYFPSAVLTHFNLDLASHYNPLPTESLSPEQAHSLHISSRFSMVLYTPGSVYQYFHCDHKPANQTSKSKSRNPLQPEEHRKPVRKAHISLEGYVEDEEVPDLFVEQE